MPDSADNKEFNVFAESGSDGSLQAQVFEILNLQRGLDFSAYHQKTLLRRLHAFLMNHGLMGNMEDYLEQLRNSPAECDRLINALTVQVSHFFRNSMVWEIMGARIIPELIQVKKEARNTGIRIWSAGCSTGEEAYSLAVMIREILKKEIGDWAVSIFATDISMKALEIAQAGFYPRDKFEYTKMGLVDKYFIPKDDGFLVSPVIHQMVSFSFDDLTSMDKVAPADSVFGSFDIICFRNVLIYFDKHLQKRVMNKLIGTLAPNGWLILGDAESPSRDFRERLTTIDYSNRIYRRNS